MDEDDDLQPTRLDMGDVDMPGGPPPSAPPSPPYSDGGMQPPPGAAPPMLPGLPGLHAPAGAPPYVTAPMSLSNLGGLMNSGAPGPSSSAPPPPFDYENPTPFVCHWNESGFRGVYRNPGTRLQSRAWEAWLPLCEKKGTEKKNSQRSLGCFSSPEDAARCVAVAAHDAKLAEKPGECGPKVVDLQPSRMRPFLDAAKQGGGLDVQKMLKQVRLEDIEDGHKDALELATSNRSASGFTGVHKAGNGKWQTQVYWEGNLYHCGHRDSAEQCARMFTACTQLMAKLQASGDIAEGAEFKSTRKKKEKPAPAPRVGFNLESVALEGEDADLQLHACERADSGCLGVYYNAHVHGWAAVAPGLAMLGYFDVEKDAAIAFSRHVAAVARRRGKHYPTRPWPRIGIDHRQFTRIKLTSCVADAEAGGEAASVEAQVQARVDVAECLFELITKVDKAEKERLAPKLMVVPPAPPALVASESAGPQLVPPNPNPKPKEEALPSPFPGVVVAQAEWAGPRAEKVRPPAHTPHPSAPFSAAFDISPPRAGEEGGDGGAAAAAQTEERADGVHRQRARQGAGARRAQALGRRDGRVQAV